MSEIIQGKVVYDKELVGLLKRGDEWAFQVLFRRYRKMIFSIAYGITLDKEDSQDILQEVFLQVHQHIANFRGDASLSTWLHRITVNRCLNWRRRWARRFKWLHVSIGSDDKEVDNLPASDLSSPEIRVAGAQTRQRINSALKKIPDQARVVFVLREIEGLSYEAIADATGIKLGTVRSRLFNARKRLKQILQPLMEADR